MVQDYKFFRRNRSVENFVTSYCTSALELERATNCQVLPRGSGKGASCFFDMFFSEHFIAKKSDLNGLSGVPFAPISRHLCTAPPSPPHPGLILGRLGSRPHVGGFVLIYHLITSRHRSPVPLLSLCFFVRLRSIHVLVLQGWCRKCFR